MISYSPPAGWQFPTIEEIAAPKEGAIRIGPFGSALKKHEYSAAGIRVLGIEDVMPNELVSEKQKFIPEAKYRELTQYTVTPGDVLVTNMGTVGRACVVPDDLQLSIISSHLIKVTFDSRTVWPPYASRMLNSCPLVVAQIKVSSHGAIMSGFNSGLLKQLRIPLPPLIEQRRIAEILDKADALRAKRRAALAQLATLTQAIFLDMFGDPAMNPKGWPLRTIRDFIESASYGTSDKAAATGEFPVLRMNNITATGEMDLTDLKYMNIDEHQRERYLVRPGDVLFNRTNSPDLVGKTAIYRNSRPMAYAGYLIRLRVQNGNDPEYLAAFLNTEYSKRVLRGMCKSIIGMANINARELQALRIPGPPSEMQKEFARLVRAVEKWKTVQHAASAEVDGLFASLQHRAFRGEL